MSLKNLLELSQTKNNKKIGMSEERIEAQLPNLRKLISFYREYPDLLIDDIKGENCKFKFYFYQRIFIRIVMRHRYVYATFPRAWINCANKTLIVFGQTFLIAWTLKIK